jgi:hypothetical protein
MSSDLGQSLEIALVLLTSGVFVISSVRAFGARRVLASLAHRSRALWMVVLGILMIPFELSVIVYLAGPTGLASEDVLVLAFVIAFNLVAFFYLDSTIKVARAMDFFHRDTFHWGKTNMIALALFVVGIVGTLFSPIGGTLFNLLWIGTFGYVAIVLIATSLRVRDRAMRTYTKWVGLFAVVVALPFLYQGSPYPVLVGFAVSSFVYYRATVSLLITGQVTRTAGQ